MPIYEFRCDGCGTSREARTGFAESRDIELICTGCGGTMHVAPVMRFAVIGRAADPASSTPLAPKSCGHGHACRCSIRLNRPNPFRDQLPAASRPADDA